MSVAALATYKSGPDFSDPRCWRHEPFCPLCGSAQWTDHLQAPDVHYSNPGLFRVVRCVDCGLNFMNPQPTLAYLETAYPANYYSYQVQELKTLRQRIAKRAKTILRVLLGYHGGETHDPKFKTPGRMLDLGCGTGAFLATMRARGWDVSGVEFSAIAAHQGRDVLGLDIFVGTLEQALYPPESFDYVRSNHSFEHLTNPRQVLKEIRRILKPNGKLFIGVPNVEGFAARSFGTSWWYLGVPVHPFGYSPATLSRLLADEGFEVDHVRYCSTFAGLFGSLQIRLNRGRPAFNGWVVNNPASMVIGHWMAKALDLFRAGDCVEIIARPSGAPLTATETRNANDQFAKERE